MNKLSGFLHRVPTGVKAAIGVGAISGGCFWISGYTGMVIQKSFFLELSFGLGIPGLLTFWSLDPWFYP